MPQVERVKGSSRRDPAWLWIAAGALLVARVATGVYEERNPVARPDLVSWVPAPIAPERALATNKPILYEFSADWCGPCQQLEREVFADEKQARILSQFVVPVRVIDRQRELGHNSPLVDSLQRVHDVRAFPTLVLVDADGRAIDRMEGFPGAERFMSWVATAGAKQRIPKTGATFTFP